MKIKRIPLGMLGANSYLVTNEETRQAVLIDLGGTSEQLWRSLEESGCELQAVLLTHAHFDHIMGIDELVRRYPVPVYVHEADEKMLCEPELNMSIQYTAGYAYHRARTVKDGEKLELAGCTFEVIHTPGHTPGGCCYYVASRVVLFSGDTVFQNSIGRTDFPGSSMSAMIHSLRDKLFTLPDDVIVYPGHMAETTIGHEKRYNPYVS